MKDFTYTFYLSLFCIAIDLFLMISGFADGNTISGMGWLCALLANIQVAGFSYSLMNNK